jgi:hypothetical protein
VRREILADKSQSWSDQVSGELHLTHS